MSVLASLEILLFKVTYSYKLKILLMLRQVKKISNIAIKKKNGEAYIAILKSLKISQISIKKNKKVL